MEDIQKMIERYKRELLECGKSQIHEQPEKEKTEPIFEQPQIFGQSAERKKPKVIGYISEDAHKELEEMNVPDNILENITQSVPDTAVPPSEDMETITYELPADNEENSEEYNGEMQNGSSDAALTDGNITDNAADNSTEFNSAENSADIADNASGRDENTESQEFSEPQYTEIPSFQETREETTEESKPEENIPTENSSGVTENFPTEPSTEYGDNETVSNAQAERLTEQPISGTDVDEQLTGRSFEDTRTPRNNPADVMQQNGSQAEPGNFAETFFGSIEDFESQNRGSGTILFRVYTAREALPIKNAVCKVTKEFDGNVHTFYTLTTDQSGRTPASPLPAPSKKLSQDSANKIQPFALYDATITREGYADVELREIPVFDGVSSIQQVAMIPVPNTNGAREENENAR